MLLYEIFSNKWLSGKGSIYIYSDPHFGDLESYKFRFPEYFKDNPPVTNELDEMQIKNINKACGKNDTLIILGDIGDIECVKKLKAKYKILIMGNHDKGASNYLMRWDAKWWPDYDVEELKKDGYTEVLDYPPGAILYGKRINEELFDEVYEGPLMINDRVILSHEPIQVPNYMFNIHGHVHNMESKDDDHHLNVCAEHINYTPINLMKQLKDGLLKNIDNIHRMTIDTATKNRRKKNLREIDKKLKELYNK